MGKQKILLSYSNKNIQQIRGVHLEKLFTLKIQQPHLCVRITLIIDHLQFLITALEIDFQIIYNETGC